MGIKLIMSLQCVFVSIFLYMLTGAQIAVFKVELLGFFWLAFVRSKIMFSWIQSGYKVSLLHFKYLLLVSYEKFSFVHCTASAASLKSR